MCTNNESNEMTTSSKEADSSSKQEANTSEAKIITNSPSPWLRYKDPRIVRVSRTFGGKDRHSKVCTIKGLRDRRVRLSVPTAIQLYDLQDRLGLGQPSKVVDWLLNAAKDEIDELPPLPALPSGNFGLNHQEIISSSDAAASQSNKQGFRSIKWEGEGIDGKEINLTKRVAYQVKQDRDNHGAEASSINFLHKPSPNSSLPNLLNNALPFGSYYHLEPSIFPFSQLGSHGFTSQTEDLHNFNVVPLPSALSLSSGSQILVCPPPHVEIDPRQINHFQMFSPSSHNLSTNPLSQIPHAISHSMRPFHFGTTSRFLPPHSGTASQSDKDQAFPSK